MHTYNCKIFCSPCYLLRSRTPLRSLVHSFAHSLVGQRMIGWLFILCFLLFWTIVRLSVRLSVYPLALRLVLCGQQRKTSVNRRFIQKYFPPLLPFFKCMFLILYLPSLINTILSISSTSCEMFLLCVFVTF